MQLLILALASLATAVVNPQFYVDNKCPFALWLKYENAQGATSPVQLSANKITAFQTPIGGPSLGQNAVTISRQPSISSPLQALWSVGSNGIVYYDLSTIYGDPLRAEGFQLLAGKDSNGFSVVCKPRTPTGGDCPNTYSPSNPRGQDALFTQGNNANLIFQFCNSSGKP